MSEQDPEQNNPEDYADRSWMKPSRPARKKKKPPLASLTAEERDARLKKIIMAGLGKAWMFWPPRNEVKRRCAHPERPGWFICELNHDHVVEKIDVDHIVPCVKPSDGFTSWDAYINSRFVLADKLQGICTSCHKAKSKEENRQRREMKRAKKTNPT